MAESVLGILTRVTFELQVYLKVTPLLLSSSLKGFRRVQVPFSSLVTW